MAKKFGREGMGFVLKALENVFLKIADAVKSVNGVFADENGDIAITTVPLAQNLQSESSQTSIDAFIQRTTGGGASIDNGDSWLIRVRGNNVHDGYVAEQLTMVVTSEGITATIDRDTFVAYVDTSGTITLVYSSDWSADPALYGITIDGTPAPGDTIVISYTKEERGTITVANPQSFVSTGWNLFNVVDGYARVVKYAHGYRIEGPFTALQFASTLTGVRTSITVTNNNFDIPSDGYVFVTGGDSTTVIYATWEDWTEGYDGELALYSASEVDLSTVMSENFPNGLLKAGSVFDEIDLNIGQAFIRVERMEYTAENLETAKASGREYEYDENYIYIAKATPTTANISINGAVPTNDHGIEYFTETEAPVNAEILYGTNLKNKLERDVLTISQQELSVAQKTQVRQNIGAEIAGRLDSLFTQRTFTASYSLASGAGKGFTETDLNYSIPAGYKPFAVSFVNTGKNTVAISGTRLYFTSASINVRVVNNSSATESGTVTVCVIFIKDEGVFDYDS